MTYVIIRSVGSEEGWSWDSGGTLGDWGDLGLIQGQVSRGVNALGDVIFCLLSCCMPRTATQQASKLIGFVHCEEYNLYDRPSAERRAK